MNKNAILGEIVSAAQALSDELRAARKMEFGLVDDGTVHEDAARILARVARDLNATLLIVLASQEMRDQRRAIEAAR